MRKHSKDMTQAEIKFLLSEVRSRKLNFSFHANDRMSEKKVSQQQISAALSYGGIVEAHNDKPNELRVLIRGKVNGNFVCLVVSLATNEVVTAYWNKQFDHHATLDKTAYNWQVNLVELQQKHPTMFGRKV